MERSRKAATQRLLLSFEINDNFNDCNNLTLFYVFIVNLSCKFNFFATNKATTRETGSPLPTSLARVIVNTRILVKCATPPSPPPASPRHHPSRLQFNSAVQRMPFTERRLINLTVSNRSQLFIYLSFIHSVGHIDESYTERPLDWIRDSSWPDAIANHNYSAATDINLISHAHKSTTPTHFSEGSSSNEQRQTLLWKS